MSFFKNYIYGSNDYLGRLYLIVLSLTTFGLITLYSISIDPLSCLLYTSPSPRDLSTSRMPSSA